MRLIDSLATTAPLAEVFSDRAVLQAMLDFESALARAEARAGLIPPGAAHAITAAARAEAFDAAKLAAEALRAGTPAIPLVKALTEQVRLADSQAAGFVHWGATSQDVCDTALVLLLRTAIPLLEADVARLDSALQQMAEAHSSTVMLGRTLLQPAPPVTFGLKAAGWLGAIRRGRKALAESSRRALILQFGGASGTLAALEAHGIAVSEALSAELGLALPEAPWHTQRDRLAEMLCACGVLTGSLGKMARDISLLMQYEVAEAAETGGQGRGGSSTMPHKRNPIGCSLTLAAAHRTPGLVAGFLSAMVQEHERGAGGGQSEWPTISAVVQALGLALSSMAEVAEGLVVDPCRMRSNVEATHGIVFAERAMMLLGEALGRDAAHRVLEEAARRSLQQGRRLSEVLKEMPEVAAHLDDEVLRNLEDPEQYLGSAREFAARLLGALEE